MLAATTGVCVPLNRGGILELVTDDETAAARRGELPAGAEWVSRQALRALEPEVADMAGAVYHPDDGAVDNAVLLRALWKLVGASRDVTILQERAEQLELDATRAAVRTPSGQILAGESIVLAAGAWAPQLRGLPRSLPVRPVRGQAISVGVQPLAHVTYGPSGYVVPRGDGTSVVGATMEEVGFEVATTRDGVASLVTAAIEIAPALGARTILAQWSGLRPVTPDLLPILGRDPDFPALLYACGHSRNGILLGPLTGECVAAIVAREEPGYDLVPFSVERFAELGASAARRSL
jgi:glycine oxidase